MGNIKSYINQESTYQIQKVVEQDSLETVLVKSDMKLDFNRPVSGYLLQLQNWSLQEIRYLYCYFRQRQKYPFINKSIFKTLISNKFSEKTANHIYDIFSKNQKYINIYELISVLLVLSYSNTLQKVHFMFLMFDLNNNNFISVEEVMLAFVCIINGIARATNQHPPSYYNIEYFAKIMFLKSDLTLNNQLSMREVLQWVDNNHVIREFFDRYEPGCKVKQDLQVFKDFAAFTDQESVYIGKLIKSQSQDNETFQKFIDDVNRQINHSTNKTDNRLPRLTHKFGLDKKMNLQKLEKLRLQKRYTKAKIHTDRSQSTFRMRTDVSESSLPQMQLFQKARKVMDISRSSMFLSQTQADDFDKYQELQNLDFIDKTLQKHQINYQKDSPNKFMNRRNTQKIVQMFQQQHRKNDMSVTLKGNSSESIVVKGYLINQSSIFRLKEWFDRMSGYEEYLDLDKYVETQKDKPFMKDISQNLFKFMDQKQEGKIKFIDLMNKLYPELNREQQQQVDRWASQYEKIKNRENRKGLIQYEKKPKQVVVVPDTAYARIKEVFDIWDKEGKKYLTIHDLTTHLSFGFSTRQIDELFHKYSKKNGKMEFLEFVKMILPSNYDLGNIKRQYKLKSYLEVIDANTD